MIINWLSTIFLLLIFIKIQMPILSKFRFRTPFDEFDNYLGEEMNTFSGFTENDIEEEVAEESEEVIAANTKEEINQKNYWNRMVKSIFKFYSDLFQ